MKTRQTERKREREMSHAFIAQNFRVCVCVHSYACVRVCVHVCIITCIASYDDAVQSDEEDAGGGEEEEEGEEP